MYWEFYGFEREAFGDHSDPQFYFDSLTHRKAMSYLAYGLKQGEGIIVVTGEPGSGKTMLADQVHSRFDPNRVSVAMMDARSAVAASIEAAVAKSVDLEDSHDNAGARIEEFLQAKAGERQRVLLVIDDCQILSVDALDGLCALSHRYPAIQPLLLGRPEFKRLLSRSPELTALRERVVAAYGLEPLQTGEIEGYAKHRLKCAGWSDTPQFHKNLWLPLHKRSEGNPLALNGAMSQLLAYGEKEELSLLKSDMLPDPVLEGTRPTAVKSEPEPSKESQSVMGAEPEKQVVAHTPGGLAEAQLRAVQQAFSERDRALASLRREIAELRDAAPGNGRESESESETETRLAAIEARLDEQDTSLKQVMTAVVEILEQGRDRHAA